MRIENFYSSSNRLHRCSVWCAHMSYHHFAWLCSFVFLIFFWFCFSVSFLVVLVSLGAPSLSIVHFVTSLTPLSCWILQVLTKCVASWTSYVIFGAVSQCQLNVLWWLSLLETTVKHLLTWHQISDADLCWCRQLHLMTDRLSLRWHSCCSFIGF